METPLSTAIDYLSAAPHTTGFRYFDDASGQYWCSYACDLITLGEDLLSYRGNDDAGELIWPRSEYDIYSFWCSNTSSMEA